MRRIFLFFLVISSILSLNEVIAQQDFRTGIIITNSEDTVRGYLQYMDNNSFKKCTFKNAHGDKVIDYLPGEISAYRFDNGKYFISKEVPLKSGKELLFLEYLIKGKANVYYMRDDIKHYFIETETKEIIEISEPKELIQNDGGLYVKPSLYKGKLKYILPEPAIYSKIEKVKLDHSSLIDLAKDYHNLVCDTEECIVYEKKEKPISVKVGLSAGISYNSFSFGPEFYTNFSMGKVIGLRLDVHKFRSDHSSVQVGFIFNKFSNYSTNDAISPSRSLSTRVTYEGTDYYRAPYYLPLEDFDVNALALKIPITYNYTFSLGSKIRPYIGGGFASMVYLNQNKDLMVSFIWREYGKSIPSVHLGAIGVIGTKYMLKNGHSLFIEMTYEHTANWNVNNYSRLLNKNISITSGFTF